MAHGVDTSEHQGAVDWDEMASHEEFAIVKITEGLTFVDAQAARSIAECQRIGLPLALYHWGHPENRPTTEGAAAEAHRFCDVAESMGYRPGQFSVDGRRSNGAFLDIEGSAPKQVAHVLAWWSRHFCATVGQRWGPLSGVYSYDSFLNETPLGELRHDPAVIRWWAAYGSRRPDGSNIWQHTSGHLGRNLDGNFADVTPATSVHSIDTRSTPAMVILKMHDQPHVIVTDCAKSTRHLRSSYEVDASRWVLAVAGVKDVRVQPVNDDGRDWFRELLAKGGYSEADARFLAGIK